MGLKQGIYRPTIIFMFALRITLPWCAEQHTVCDATVKAHFAITVALAPNERLTASMRIECAMLLPLFCGSLAAIASIAGKIALSPYASNPVITAIASNCIYFMELDDFLCNVLLYFVRSLCVALMLGGNALMMGLFLKSLERHSSFVVTVLSTAANYLGTGYLGAVVLQEPVGRLWVAGAVCISLGMCIIGMSQVEAPLTSSAAAGRRHR